MVKETTKPIKVTLADLGDAHDGWTYDDEATSLKLLASVRRLGQIRPILTRRIADGTRVIVDGRRLARALRDAGETTAWAVDLGRISDAEAVKAALSVEIRHETDYARLALAVAGLLDAGATAAELSSAGPFTAERIGYFGVLSKFDWSQFAEKTDGQSVIDWDSDGLEPPGEAIGSGGRTSVPAGDLSPVAEPEPPAGIVVDPPGPPTPETVEAVEAVLAHAAPAQVVEAVKAVVRRRKASATPAFDFGMDA